MGSGKSGWCRRGQQRARPKCDGTQQVQDSLQGRGAIRVDVNVGMPHMPLSDDAGGMGNGHGQSNHLSIKRECGTTVNVALADTHALMICMEAH